MSGAEEGVLGEQEEEKLELDALQKRIARLEEENDVMAIAATREPQLLEDIKRLTERINELEEENKALKETNRRLSHSGGGGGGEEGVSSGGASTSQAEIEDPMAPFVVPGDRATAARRVTNIIPGCHGGINVLCARVCPGASDIVASGGVDKSLLVSRLAKSTLEESDGELCEPGATEMGRLRLAAPVLSMDFRPADPSGSQSWSSFGGLLLAGCMDGSSHLVAVVPDATSVNGNDDEEEGEEEDIIGRQESKGGEAQQTSDRDVKLLASLKDHSKYLVACRWAPDGGAFVTASHDKVVTLYVRQGSGGGGGKGVGGTGYEQATRLYLPEAIECVEFVKGAGGGLELVISARGQAHLTYVNLETMQQRKVSLNEKTWDTHVSFTVMSLAASTDGKYLLGATDKSRNILWPAGSNMRVRTLMGQSTDGYFQPRVAWEPSGKFSYCNSSGDNDVHVHCLASGRVVDRLKGHSSVIRDLQHDPFKRVMVTASYDKTVRVWGQ